GVHTWRRASMMGAGFKIDVERRAFGRTFYFAQRFNLGVGQPSSTMKSFADDPTAAHDHCANRWIRAGAAKRLSVQIQRTLHVDFILLRLVHGAFLRPAACATT